MVDYNKEMINRVREKLGENPGVEEVVNYLMKTGTLDRYKCKIALSFKEYEELVDNGMKKIDAKNIVADKYCVTRYRLEKYIYYHSETRL